jgi:hypothetical protein
MFSDQVPPGGLVVIFWMKLANIFPEKFLGKCQTQCRRGGNDFLNFFLCETFRCGFAPRNWLPGGLPLSWTGGGGSQRKNVAGKSQRPAAMYFLKNTSSGSVSIAKKKRNILVEKNIFQWKKKVGRPLPGGRGLGACNVSAASLWTCFLEDEMKSFGGN